MKTEKEIREFIKKLEEVDDDEILDGFYSMSDKCGHWLDCFEWVLKNRK